MKLIKCTECEEEYKEIKKRCPNCGCPNKEHENKFIKETGASPLIVLLLVFAYFIFNNYVFNHYVSDLIPDMLTKTTNFNLLIQGFSRGLKYTLLYMAIPTILRLKNKEPYETQKGKKIAIINSVVCILIIIVIAIISKIKPSGANFWIPIVYYYINYQFLTKYFNKTKEVKQ